MSAQQKIQKARSRPAPKPEPDSPAVNPEIARKWFQ